MKRQARGEVEERDEGTHGNETIVYNNPILLPILSTSVIRATQGGITAITAPLLNPYIAANAMINLAELSGSVVPSKANVLRTTSTTEAESEEAGVEVS